MQSNIINMFSSEITEDSLYRSLSEKSGYTSSVGISFPVSLLMGSSRQEALMNRHLIPLMETAIEELHTLKQQELSFMQKFERILRIVYQSNRNNPELILLYQEIGSGEGSGNQNSMQLCFRELHRQVQMILKLQAYNDGIIREEGVMEQLIFFMLGQILQNFQRELALCCRDMVNGDSEAVFPSEEEMLDRFYTPLAVQLKGVIAS